MENHEIVTKGFDLLNSVLAPYVAQQLSLSMGTNWWREGVLMALYDDQRHGLPSEGEWTQLVDSLDVARSLRLVDIHWTNVFKKKLAIDNRSWDKELINTRNTWAHLGGEDFTDDDTWRALDTMARLCESIDTETAEEIRSLLRESRYGSAEGSAAMTESVPAAGSTRSKSAGILQDIPMTGLPCWRDVMQPHPDVAQGRYKNAEFAANLAQVARGAAAAEYQDPVEFFNRTYITEGMAGLITQAFKRVFGKDGEPVIQLKTAFGGGKTHSMLALYHLMRGQVSVDKIPAVKPILDGIGVSTLPRVNVAVIVGTDLNPAKSRRPIKLPGVTVNTLWGEIAAQLAESADRPELYEYVKEADKKGVAPGTEALKNLFDDCGPCLILVDELVAYAKVIHDKTGLPAGSFDNFITFVQELTEAASESKNSLVVASLPESALEVGGEAGQLALETIEKTFGRMESVWKPVTANEGFEVVRRRLFLDCKDEAARESVCSAFSRMYAENSSDFPVDTKELEYKKRLISCYPIHPEVFDKLYTEWATLEKFQRTRGVLRLMATVIHDLWMNQDADLMIMPGSFSLDNPDIRNELTRYLDENWNGIIDGQVDGRSSVPYIEDEKNQRFGKVVACRRVSRTILLGSAPSVRDQSVRGIEASRIRLGVVQPGENIAVFNDALSTLRTKLSYLYTNAAMDRYWYDTRPTLRKTVEDRMQSIPDSDADFEIKQRLKGLRKEAPFGGLHINPATSLDVPDEQTARLVIMNPSDTYRPKNPNNDALTAANEILNQRGQSPRIYRNMLAFVAPDHDAYETLKAAVKQYLAWKSIKDEKERLNLDAEQNRETEANIKRWEDTVGSQISGTYCWLLAPYIDKNVDLKTVEWSAERISGGEGSIVTRAAKKLAQEEMLVTNWAPALLLMELDNLLWKDRDSIGVKTLWDYLCTYCYLPRLASYEVLEHTIRVGLNSKEYFAIAEGESEGRYLELRYNTDVASVGTNCVLVKLSKAKEQYEREATERTATETPAATSAEQPGSSQAEDQVRIDDVVQPTPNPAQPAAHTPSSEAAATQKTHFFLSKKLDNTRINRDVNTLVDEIISHLTSVDGSTVEISIEVDASFKNGVPVSTQRTVNENCKTLKVDTAGFEE